MNDAETIRELKEKVAISCRVMGTREITKGAQGHVSARVPGTDWVLIKGKGPDEEALEFATVKDVIMINLAGDIIDAPPGLTAPNETSMHLAVLRARPEVGSVIHTHPFWAVALMACDKPLVGMVGAYDGQASLRMSDNGIPVYPRTVTIVNDELGADLMEFMGTKDVCLLKGHGMTTAGRNVEEATSNSLTLFRFARLNYLGQAIGGPREVPDIEEHRARWSDERPRWGGRKGTSTEPSGWRHERRRLEKYFGD